MAVGEQKLYTEAFYAPWPLPERSET
jgi:hypothetical protein